MSNYKRQMVYNPCVKTWLVLVLLCVSVQTQTASERLDAFLGKWDQKDSPGMAVLLIRDGRIEYRKNLGLADVETGAPITSDSQFQLGSVTKAFTAMAIMILADEGKLRFARGQREDFWRTGMKLASSLPTKRSSYSVKPAR
jgi:hypothetical protein